MKQLIGFLLGLCGFGAIAAIGIPLYAASTDMAGIEQKVVQLRITRAEEPKAEQTKRKPKIENMKEKEIGRAVCSGAFVSEYGHILTARHCAAGAATIEVETYDQQIYNATTVYISSTADLALLHINRRNCAFFSLAKSVTRGEKVYVLGSPLAINDTLATGIVAKLWGDLMLIDCSVLPGNSGGPAFNENGELTGITTAGFVVFLGMTHLNIAQSLDTVYFFLGEAYKHL